MEKRNINRWIGLGLIFLTLMVATAAYGQQAQDEYCASLSDFEGEVFIQKAGEEDWLPVEKGMPLENHDRLKTGKDGYAEILYDDGSLVKMEENSQITLEEVSADYKSKKISSKISLWFGRLLLNIVKFTHPQSRFSVKTPTVVAGVRGTEFVMEALTEEKSDVGVIAGEVGVAGLDEQGKALENNGVILKPGFQTSGFRLQKPIRPIPLKEQMLQHAAKLELLRKKAIDTRQNLQKIIENRIKTRQILIEKWKNYREQNVLLLQKQREELRGSGLKNFPGGLDRSQPPQIKRIPKIERQPQLQKLPPGGPILPQGQGIRKLPLRKLPPPSGTGPAQDIFPPPVTNGPDVGNPPGTTQPLPASRVVKAPLIKPLSPPADR